MVADRSVLLLVLLYHYFSFAYMMLSEKESKCIQEPSKNNDRNMKKLEVVWKEVNIDLPLRCTLPYFFLFDALRQDWSFIFLLIPWHEWE